MSRKLDRNGNVAMLPQVWLPQELKTRLYHKLVDRGMGYSQWLRFVVEAFVAEGGLGGEEVEQFKERICEAK